MGAYRQKRARHISGEGAPRTQPVPEDLRIRQAKRKAAMSDAHITRVVESKPNAWLAWCSCGWSDSTESRGKAWGAIRSHSKSHEMDVVPKGYQSRQRKGRK